MNNFKFIFWGCCILLFQTTVLKAQNISPQWAKQIYGTKGGGAPILQSIATDKAGNIYALSDVVGNAYAGGQFSTDSTVKSLLTSWDCDGNLRWMKTFGGTSPNSNIAIRLGIDTLGSIYISGYVPASQVSLNAYWNTDTAINIAVGNQLTYLIKYNSQGQFQWFRTPVDSSKSDVNDVGLSVSPTGDVYYFAVLDTGVYGNGSFTISSRKYYAIRYNAAGTYQTVIPFDMTPFKKSNNTYSAGFWRYDPATDRFYSYITYDTNYSNNLLVGNTTITPPTTTNSKVAVLAAFNKQGQNIWVKQGSSSKHRSISDVVIGNDGTLYIAGISEVGNVFCNDTCTNTSGAGRTTYMMALDTNASVLWSNYSGSSSFSEINSISKKNNTIAAVGRYSGTLTWNSNSLTSIPSYPPGYMLRANAATGAVFQLSQLNSSAVLNTEACLLDKNSNIYVKGQFTGNLILGTDSFTSQPQSYSFNHFLVKYKNVPCGCNLLQPTFNIGNTTSSGTQFTYTGQVPYATITWDFGDGSATVSATNPIHHYTSPGTYLVGVTVTDTCGSNTICKYVKIESATSLYDLRKYTNIYPNPALNEIIIENVQPESILVVIDIYGRRMKSLVSKSSTININIEDLNAGYYILSITDKKGTHENYRFMKQ